MNEIRLAEKQPPYEPHVLSRLFWWWLIFLGPSQLISLIYVLFFDPSPPDFYPLSVLLIVVFFPIGLFPFFPPAAYIFYLSHLICTLYVRSKRSFKIAMTILIIAIIINLAGCAEMNRQMSHFSP